MEVVNRYVAIRHHIDGAPTEADFEVRETTARWAPGSGEVLVRNLYLSIDPYQLNRMKRGSASHLAVDGIVPGEVTKLIHFTGSEQYSHVPGTGLLISLGRE
jgi:NADPH-dependent curcumin reductase CurA